MLKYAKLSKYKIKKVARYFCNDLSATQTSRLLEINRNIINRYFNIFRKEIYKYQIAEFESLVGHIELDESYFGANRVRGFKGKLKRGRGTRKQPVFGVFKRNGHVYTEIIPNCKKRTINPSQNSNYE